MAIICPRCGRHYDVTLFQFGRTIDCSCGCRVGLEHRIGPPLSDAEPRFIADAMLGRLARWLRTLGFDTAYDDAISDPELVRRAFEERRYVLTRDRRLPEQWRMKNCLVLGSDAPVDQLREVVAHLGLEPSDRLFTRCRICNAELVPASSEQVEARVPASVREQHTAFVRCPDCGRVYWEGSHTERMMAVLARVFES